MPSGEETEPDSKLAARDKSFRTQLCYDLRGIGIYKENHIPHFSLQWRWIQYFPNSFCQFDRLRVNFVLARPRGFEAQMYGAGSICQQIRCTGAATRWTCAEPAAALTLSTEMVLQQGLKQAHALLPGLRLLLPSLLRVRQHWLNAPVDTHVPGYPEQTSLVNSHVLCTHFRASHRACRPALAWAFFHSNSDMKTSPKWVCTLTKLLLQTAFPQMGSSRYFGHEIFTPLCPCVCTPHPFHPPSLPEA